MSTQGTFDQVAFVEWCRQQAQETRTYMPAAASDSEYERCSARVDMYDEIADMVETGVFTQ